MHRTVTGLGMPGQLSSGISSILGAKLKTIVWKKKEEENEKGKRKKKEGKRKKEKRKMEKNGKE